MSIREVSAPRPELIGNSTILVGLLKISGMVFFTSYSQIFIVVLLTGSGRYSRSDNRNKY